MVRRSWLAAGILCLIAIFAWQLALQARRDSVTWDEAHHLYDGYNIWRHADFGLNPEVPPLIKMADAAPLLDLRLNTPPDQHRDFKSEAFFDGRDFLFSNDANRILFRARMAAMAFSLLLALLVFAASKEMFSMRAGFLALALFVFDPNFLAHGTLVTTDVGSALTFFAVVYGWYRWRIRPSWRRLLVTGIVLGFALVTKFTGILLFPVLGLLALAEFLWPLRFHAKGPRTDGPDERPAGSRNSGHPSNRRRLFGHLAAGLAAICASSWIVLWGFYRFRYAARPGNLALNPRLAAYVPHLTSRLGAHLLLLLARLHAFPEAWLFGLADTKITADTYTSYLFGHVYPHGNVLYFPACFAIKSTLPFLLLFVIAIVTLAARRMEAPRAVLCLTLPPALYFVVAASSNMNIGARHLLPIYPFLYVLGAGAASALLARTKHYSPAFSALFAALVIWQAADTATVHPAEMAFGNGLWGGPARVHFYLSDANVDWGQQLNDVRAWLAAHGVRASGWSAPGVVSGQPAPPPSQTTLDGAESAAQDCWFVYFPDGVIDPPQYGIPCHRLPTQETLFWLREPTNLPAAVDGFVLISASDLAGFELGPGPLNPYDQFNHLRPMAVIDEGVYVFQGHFDLSLASGLNHAAKAGLLLGHHQPEAAYAEAEQAVALAPDLVPPQAVLGDTLLVLNRPAEARVAYQRALQLAETVEPALQTEWVPRLQARLAAR